MRRFSAWIHGWIETLKIKYLEPDLYRELTQPISDDDVAG